MAVFVATKKKKSLIDQAGDVNAVSTQKTDAQTALTKDPNQLTQQYPAAGTMAGGQRRSGAFAVRRRLKRNVTPTGTTTTIDTTGIRGPQAETPTSTTTTPVNVDAQSQQLATLATQMQTAREAGDMGKLNTLTAQYQSLVQSMQKQVAATPATTATTAATEVAPTAKVAAPTTAQGETSSPAPTTIPEAETTGTTTATGQKQQEYNETLATRTGNARSQLKDKGGLPDTASDVILNWMTQNNYQMPSGQQLNDMLEQAGWTAKGDGTFTNAAGDSFFLGNDTGLAVLRDWSAEAQNLTTTYNEQGQYEDRLNEMFDSQAAQSGYKIEDLPETLKNEMYREAIDAMKNGKDATDIINDYLSYFNENPDFSLGNNQYQATADELHAYQNVATPEVTKENITVGGGDTSKISEALASATQSAAGDQATQLALQAAAKRLQEPGGFTSEDIDALTAGKFSQIESQLQADISALQHDAAASGLAEGVVVQQVAELRQKALADKQTIVADLLKEKMANDETGFQNSLSTLTGLSKQEADRLVAARGQTITGQTAATEITAETAQAQAEIDYKSKALFQEGQLTAAGQQIDQNLQAYNMSLEKYQTDKGFDEAGFDRDLKERIAQSGATQAEAELEFNQIKESITAAQEQTKQTDTRNAEIANLEQDAAQGDQDAAYKIQGLKVEQDLQNAGFTNDQQKTLGTLIYGLLSQRIQITADMEMLLKKYQLEEALQGSETMDFIGQILGMGATVVGGALGGKG